MSDDRPDTGRPAALPGEGPRPVALVAAVTVALVEAVALLAYTAFLLVAAVQNPGSIASGPVVVIIFALFAAGVALCARGLWRRSRAARTPFGVAQLFGLVIGWTMTQTEGASTWLIGAGWVVLAVSVVGIALVMSPGVGASLD